MAIRTSDRLLLRAFAAGLLALGAVLPDAGTQVGVGVQEGWAVQPEFATIQTKDWKV